MGAIKSKIFDDSTTLDPTSNVLVIDDDIFKPPTSSSLIVSKSSTSLSSSTNNTTTNNNNYNNKETNKNQSAVSDEPSSPPLPPPQTQSLNTIVSVVDQQLIEQNISSSKLDSISNRVNNKKTKNMHSHSVASFQPPDSLQKSQYFRSFRSASRRFFGSTNGKSKPSNNNEVLIKKAMM